MICFDVELNGAPYCRAGLDAHGVISVMVNWLDFDGETVSDDRDHLRTALSMAITGYRTGEAFTSEDVDAGREPPATTAVHWGSVPQGLQVGDELRIRIVESDPADADPPTETQMLPDPTDSHLHGE